MLSFKAWLHNEGFFDNVKGAWQGAKQGWAQAQQQAKQTIPVAKLAPSNDPFEVQWQKITTKDNNNPRWNDGTVDVALERMFTDLYKSQDQQQIAKWKPKLHQAMGKRGMRIAYPVHFQDYPEGWLQTVNERGAVNGNVVKILRPLVIRDNNVIIQGIVEID